MIGLVYQQHRHHHMAEGFSPIINPIEKFRTDLVTQPRQANGEAFTNAIYFPLMQTKILRMAL
jgi:hypothetical protein